YRYNAASTPVNVGFPPTQVIAQTDDSTDFNDSVFIGDDDEVNLPHKLYDELKNSEVFVNNIPE
ncbi:hypothetical protein HHI36_018148, partial [Cryptolaemus montrouzieri]